MGIADLKTSFTMSDRLTKALGSAFCCCILVLVIILCTWFSTSRSPDFSLERLYIPALNKALNSSSDTTLSFDIVFRNYGTSVYYDPVNVTFYDNPNQNHTIGNFTIPKFYQYQDDDNDMDVIHKGGTVNTTGLDVKTAKNEIMTNGFTVFRVDIAVSARYEVFLFWKSKRHQYNQGFDVKIDDTGDAANIGSFFGIIGVLLLNLIVASFLRLY